MAMRVESTWHPAFMPNSTADVTPKGIIQSQNPPSVVSIEAPTSKAASLPPSEPESTSTILEAKGEDVISEKPAEKNNDGHPELDTLREALTTSLSSPGGVEMDENTWYSDQQMVEFLPKDKANFPSEGPRPPNKHLSTTSFARTISEEVNWEESDEVDPEFNILHTETDPFKMMARSDRTNSFPQVPPAHSPAVGFEPLPNQVEEIINGIEKEPKDLFGDEDHEGQDAFFSQQAAPSNDLLAESHDATEDFGQTFGGEVRQEEDQDSQARYEEGLPLVQAAETPREASAEATYSLSDEGRDDEDGFFTQVRQPTATVIEDHPHPLERKSTMQVMDPLHFEFGQETTEPIPEAKEDTSASQSSLSKAAGGGIAVSASTILSQVLGDPGSSIHRQPEILENLGFRSGDGDLAEKWRAALAEDEFLDDDDGFLDDDAPAGVKNLDPATLFGSDDEGFLEDTDVQQPLDLLSQQTSPPIPAPVTSPNGHVVGFDNLTRAVQNAKTGSSGNRPSSSSSRYLPAGAQSAVPPPSNPFGPSAPVFTDLSRPSTTSVLPTPYAAPLAPTLSNQQSQPQRPEAQKAQSFADKSKGGYSSPYDPPMDVTKPRKRVSMQTMNRGYNQSAPQPELAPPRSSSMNTHPPPSRGSTSSLSPPTSSHSFQQSQLQSQAAPNAALFPPALKSKASFFEDLPMSVRPKAAPRNSSGLNSQGAYGPTPPQHPQVESHTLPHRAAPQPQSAGFGFSNPQQQPNLSQGLIAPERVSPYASLSSNKVPPPAMGSRYSPAPPQTQNLSGVPPPVAQSRYSPAPPVQTRPSIPLHNSSSVNAPPPILPHQPRTSSPLAHFSQDSRSNSQPLATNFDRRTSSSYESNLKPHPLPPTREVDESDQAFNVSESPSYGQSLPSYPSLGLQMARSSPPPQGFAARIVNSPPKRTASSNYLPQQAPGWSASSQTFVPPQRSQTQSPGTAYTGPKLEASSLDPYQRPASVEGPSSPRLASSHSSLPMISTTRPRGFSHGLNYVAPHDGRELDPMGRWRGAPVFVWGVGGTLISSFPKDVPRYGLNQSVPMIMRSPGEVKIRNIRDVDPLPERLTSFPGPLKGKSKKKEVVAWMSSGIQILENNASYLRTLSTLTHEDKRTEERILLWKILRVFIEYDGILEGNAAVDNAVRSVLSPGLDEDFSGNAPLYATGADLSGISHSSATISRADPVDPSSIDQLRKYLLRGDREKAVWEAVDKRLWAHAMLISNTVSKDLYKQVAQEFVQKEVKNIGDNTEPLAALYEIFAGNFEESIDELVPPSARAGFQMVSTSNATGPSRDALDGLDRWRETLGLVLSNRSTDDSQALNALGKLLSGYGRAEAAHICFLFARTHSVFGGIDDPLSSTVLVGSDHLRQPYDFDREIEPVLLSEVFEYGMSLSSTSNMATSSPHLSIYKLQHALTLAEYGYREKALQYCEAIASSITSQTRRSPYHHSLLITELDDLSKRLKQSPKDEKSSWISKPSIDKVSGSVWSTFNKFVAGEEHDTGTPGSNAGSATDVGPFARIAGGTPTISRSPSNSELYGSYNGAIGINGTLAQASKISSRYAPSGSYTPPADSQGFQPGTSYGSQPRNSLEGRSSGEQRRGPYEQPVRRDSDYRPDSQSNANTHTPSSASYTPYGNNSPYEGNGSPYGTQYPAPGNEQLPINIHTPQQPSATFDGQEQALYVPLQPSHDSSASYEPPSYAGYEPRSGGYEPPTSGYTPPSYEPATMNDEPDSPIDTRPKKKSFMNDDDDDIPALKRVPDTQQKSKAEKDREADEVFRKAAEADAARSKEATPAKKGWGLGGWFGGAKKESTDMGAQPNKPIRAKLGEESSFVYDPELKRWVNKKGGTDSTTTPSATPPPPRATGPPRSISGTGPPGPTSAPREGTPPRAVSTSSNAPIHIENAPPASAPNGLVALPAMSRSQSNGSAASGLATGPPSRPGTSLSNASSIDDLLGPPTAGGRKGTTRGKKKGRGYVDVMGDKAPGA